MEDMSTSSESSSSSSEESENLYEYLSHNIKKNRLRNFRRFANLLDVERLKKLFLKTIHEEKLEIFNYIFEKLNKVTQGGPDKYFYEECFKASVNCSSAKFMETILLANKKLPPDEMSLTLSGFTHHFEKAIVSCRFVGANEYTSVATSPLLIAIRADNYDLVSILLYYGADTCNLAGGLTAFMWAILCNSLARIQRLLINYVAGDQYDPFVGKRFSNYLYRGLLYGSPIVLDIMEQLPEDYGDDVVVLAVHIFVPPHILEKIWEIFNYDKWKMNRPDSALLFLLQSRMDKETQISYINIALNNETKLRLDIEYENSIYIGSHYIISTFYLKLQSLDVDEDTLNGLVHHLLSHGAMVHKQDVDLIYNSVKRFTPLLKFIIYFMPVEYTTFSYASLMYFHYTPVPNLELYILHIPEDLLVESLLTLKKFYAFSNQLKTRILYNIDADNDDLYNTCQIILKDVITFPSLLQLARDKYRKELCEAYDIQTSYQMMKVIKEVDMPRYLQELILFDRILYY